MNSGSLVVCVNNERYKSLKNTIVPELEPTIYTVRSFRVCGCGCNRACLLLEELVNNPAITQIAPGRFILVELMYNADDFREVVPSTSISIDELMLIKEEVPS